MAKWQRKGPKGFVKAFIDAQKQAHAGGADTFGGNPPATKTWTCPKCGSEVLARKDACPCGGKKPEPEATA
jgi:rubrerythrin